MLNYSHIPDTSTIVSEERDTEPLPIFSVSPHLCILPVPLEKVVICFRQSAIEVNASNPDFWEGIVGGQTCFAEMYQNDEGHSHHSCS